MTPATPAPFRPTAAEIPQEEKRLSHLRNLALKNKWKFENGFGSSHFGGEISLQGPHAAEPRTSTEECRKFWLLNYFTRPAAKDRPCEAFTSATSQRPCRPAHATCRSVAGAFASIFVPANAGASSLFHTHFAAAPSEARILASAPFFAAAALRLSNPRTSCSPMGGLSRITSPLQPLVALRMCASISQRGRRGESCSLDCQAPYKLSTPAA